LDKKHDPRYKAALYPDRPKGGATTPDFFKSENTLRSFLANNINGGGNTRVIELLLAEVNDRGQASILLD
jgi:hypothetical protein